MLTPTAGRSQAASNYGRVDITAVPEPTSAMLISLGGIALLASRRTRA